MYPRTPSHSNFFWGVGSARHSVPVCILSAAAKLFVWKIRSNYRNDLGSKAVRRAMPITSNQSSNEPTALLAMFYFWLPVSQSLQALIADILIRYIIKHHALLFIHHHPLTIIIDSLVVAFIIGPQPFDSPAVTASTGAGYWPGWIYLVVRTGSTDGVSSWQHVLFSLVGMEMESPQG